MRDLANLQGGDPRWIVLDGDIDPMWIESLNTVMDDNKILTLASNERIPLLPEMKLLFEISNLRFATPATVSRAGILYINSGDLGWRLFVTSWLETRENSNEKAVLDMLMDKYVQVLHDLMIKRFPTTITPVSPISHTQLLCALLEALIVPENNVPNDSPGEVYEIYFVFACIWAFGSALCLNGQTDYKSEFSKVFISLFPQSTVKFPDGCSVFDVWVVRETHEFSHWSAMVPDFEMVPELPLQACLVHSAETIRIKYFLDLLVEMNMPTMLVGLAGTGKTQLINEKLNQMDEEYIFNLIAFNFYYNSEMTQKILEKPLEKKMGKNYGPVGEKRLIYFLDDLNMPEVTFVGFLI